jgi:hypothetical protein
VLNKVLRQVLQPLSFKPHSSAESGYYDVLCADGNFRSCQPVVAEWFVDCPGYSNQHHLEWHVWFWGECPKNELGDYVPPDKQHSRQDHNIYRTISDANTKAADAEILSHNVYGGFNTCRHIPSLLSALPKSDLLYTMHIGILDHLQR